MQISTREEDFIIDTLELRSELYILNEAFTDPRIVKVMGPETFVSTPAPNKIGFRFQINSCS